MKILMSTAKNDFGRLGQTLVWMARIGSLLSCGLLLLFIAGEGLDPRHLKPQEFALLLFFPFGVALGLACGWRWSGFGGAIAVASLLGFYALHWAQSGSLPRGWAFVVFASPGFFFLLSWFCRHLARKDQLEC
jgi:hypothetical protein